MQQTIQSILNQYRHFKGGTIDAVYQEGDDSIIVEILPEETEHKVLFRFEEIQETRVLTASVLSLMDMSQGICVVEEYGLYGFALGEAETMLHVHNAPMYIIAKRLDIVP